MMTSSSRRRGCDELCRAAYAETENAFQAAGKGSDDEHRYSEAIKELK
jgi:hypothetical protein